MNQVISFLKHARNTSAKVLGTGIVVFASVEVTTKLPSEGRSSQFYHNVTDKVVTPLMRSMLRPEDAHNVALYFLRKGFAPTFRPNSLEVLSSVDLSMQMNERDEEAGGLVFPNCIGLAAGFDKDGVAIQQLMNVGFGFVEIGSVTPKPQPGNPKPRMFRLVEDNGIINRFGFNSIGVDRVEENLQSFRQECDNNIAHENESLANDSLTNSLDIIAKSIWKYIFPLFKPQPPSLLGVNLGKNKTSLDETQDYEIGIERLGAYADYLVVNISSPNTPGLRGLQQNDPIRRLLKECIVKRDALPMKNNKRRPPLFVKIAPDLTNDELEDIAKAIMELNVDGILVTNTSNQRPKSLMSKNRDESGGLSGLPIRDLSTECIRKMYKLTGGNVFLVGIGGVSSGHDAYEKMKAGASVVEIYSCMIYEGPGIVSRIRKELAEILRQNGHRSAVDVVGLDHEQVYWEKKMQRARKSMSSEKAIVDI